MLIEHTAIQHEAAPPNNDPLALARQSKSLAETERIKFAPNNDKLQAAVLSVSQRYQCQGR